MDTISVESLEKYQVEILLVSWKFNTGNGPCMSPHFYISYTLRIERWQPCVDTISVESLEKYQVEILLVSWKFNTGNGLCTAKVSLKPSFLPPCNVGVLSLGLNSFVWILLGTKPDLGWVHSCCSLLFRITYICSEQLLWDGLEAGKDRFLTEREDEAIQCRVQGYRSAHGNALNLKC